MSRPSENPFPYGNLPSPVRTKGANMSSSADVDDPQTADTKTTGRAGALRLARRLGCEGAHQMEDGNWLPCSTHEELEKSMKGDKEAFPKAPQKQPKMLNGERERGIAGIDTLDGGGLVSLKSLKMDQQIDNYLSAQKER